MHLVNKICYILLRSGDEQPCVRLGGGQCFSPQKIPSVHSIIGPCTYALAEQKYMVIWGSKVSLMSGSRFPGLWWTPRLEVESRYKKVAWINAGVFEIIPNEKTERN